jgi:hypothetical protein
MKSWLVLAAAKSGYTDIIEELSSHKFEWVENSRDICNRDRKVYVWRKYKCSECGAKVEFTRHPDYRPYFSNIEFRIECALGKARMNFCPKSK